MVRNQGHSLFCLLAFLILFSSVVIVTGHAPLFKKVLASFVFVCTIFAQFVIISISLLQTTSVPFTTLVVGLYFTPFCSHVSFVCVAPVIVSISYFFI